MNSEHIETKEYLLSLFAQGLLAVHGRRLVRDYLASNALTQPDYVIAIGKAAGAMTEGVYDIYGTDLQAALVITRAGHVPDSLRFRSGCELIIGNHPVPDHLSLSAGRHLLRFIAGIAAGQSVLCLISGGASALVEVLRPGVGIAELRRINQWLLASGWDIVRVNAVRKHLSRIKAGGFAELLAAHHVTALLISDVPGDDPAVIGSGLLVPDHSYITLLQDLSVPDWLAAILAAIPINVADLDGRPVIEPRVIGNNAMLVDAIAERARHDGYHVITSHSLLTGDACVTGTALAQTLTSGVAAVYVQGGETTVRLPPAPGIGGRNTALALTAAVTLAGHDDCVILAAGSDGSDGVSRCAGAVVDGTTVRSGLQLGMRADDYLARADAATFLERVNALVYTGPTGTNVMDVVVGMRHG